VCVCVCVATSLMKKMKCRSSLRSAAKHDSLAGIDFDKLLVAAAERNTLAASAGCRYQLTMP